MQDSKDNRAYDSLAYEIVTDAPAERKEESSGSYLFDIFYYCSDVSEFVERAPQIFEDMTYMSDTEKVQWGQAAEKVYREIEQKKQTILDEYGTDVPRFKYCLGISTDDSGNNAKEEHLYLGSAYISDNGVGEGYSGNIQTMSCQDTTPYGADVYESQYGGFKTSTNGNFLLQRVEEGEAIYQLDDLDSENVLIDVSPVEAAREAGT